MFVQSGNSGTGSGFVYNDQGLIVTNEHVIENANSFNVRIGDGTKPIPARLVGKDASSDLAVLKVDPGAVQGGLKPLQLGDSTALQPGDQTIAIGSPFGLEGTVTTGIVSSLGRTIEAPNGFPIADAIQTDAAINPGNSGGPLLDGNGNVVGVNSQIKSGSGSNSGVGFAVPVATVKFVVPQIENGGKVERAYLGVSNGDTQDLSGAVIGSVVPGGPAQQAGLQRGDKITDDRRPGDQGLRRRLFRGCRAQARGTGQGDRRARRRPAYSHCGPRHASGDARWRMSYSINDPRRPDVTPEDRRLHALDKMPEPNPSRAAHDDLENALFEIKRVIVGQEAMLERVLVALLAGGHVLLEGVPGLAKTLTVKTVADVLGGSFKRLQFTPDLVPADLVGTRIFRPDTGSFDTELGPVFCNFLLADEINRAPAKVQSALLEVMQERQVTIGHDTHHVPAPFLVLATQNPIESEGTYPLPEAQVDRFMFKLVVDYPSHRDEVSVVERSLEGGGRAREVLSPEQPDRAPARRGDGLRRPARDGVRRRADDRHARARRRQLGRVRRLAARLDQPDPRRPRPGAAARARLHAAGRRARPRARRPAPPHRADLRSARGGSRFRPRAGRRPRTRADAAHRARAGAPVRSVSEPGPRLRGTIAGFQASRGGVIDV